MFCVSAIQVPRRWSGPCSQSSGSRTIHASLRSMIGSKNQAKNVSTACGHPVVKPFMKFVIDAHISKQQEITEVGKITDLLIGTLANLTLPGPSAGVSGSLDSYCSLKPLCSGMGEVVPARTSPTLLPPPPRTVLSLSCFKVLQCINCRDWHYKS